MQTCFGIFRRFGNEMVCFLNRYCVNIMKKSYLCPRFYVV